MISYIGGKYRMAKWIGDYIPNNINLYSEIFGGAFWTYLKGEIHNIPNIEIHYNDFNRLMVNMFQCSREHEEFVKSFENIPSQDNNLFQNYLDKIMKLEETENIKNINLGDFELGFQYPYLLTQVFSGVGLKKNTKMTDLKGKYTSKFEAFRKRLKNPEFIKKLDKITAVHNLDFADAIDELDRKGAFLYFDPPYYNTENYYSFHEFGREDHLRLANKIKNMKGLFALSYYDFEELKEWFPPITLEIIEENIEILNEKTKKINKKKIKKYIYKNENNNIISIKEAIEKLRQGSYVWAKKDFAKAASAKKGVEQNKGTEILIMNYIINEEGSFIK